jgi:hypothetical protein
MAGKGGKLDSAGGNVQRKLNDRKKGKQVMISER